MRAPILFGLSLPVVLASLACTWQAGPPPIPIVRDRELLVTDDAVLSSLSGNASDDALSFRRVFEGLALSPSSESATFAWMQAWSQRLRDDGAPERAQLLDEEVTCPWLKRSPANACPTDCSSCAAFDLRLEDAPFRLVAVANRTDLSIMPDRAADGGEGRLVFALTQGPADLATSAPLPFTVITEYAQIGTATAWAAKWHALGSLSDQAFPAALSDLTTTFVGAGSLAQLRTADALTGPLVLHEFHLEEGALVATTVRDTPDFGRFAQSDMVSFASNNADAISAGTYVLPTTWLASASTSNDPTPAYFPTVPGHEAIAEGTCGGCHARTANGFQIDPMASGDAKLSRFLVDPTVALDEIGRRTQWMQTELAQ